MNENMMRVGYFGRGAYARAYARNFDHCPEVEFVTLTTPYNPFTEGAAFARKADLLIVDSTFDTGEPTNESFGGYIQERRDNPDLQAVLGVICVSSRCIYDEGQLIVQNLPEADACVPPERFDLIVDVLRSMRPA